MASQRTSTSQAASQPDSDGGDKGLGRFLIANGLRCPPEFAPSPINGAAAAVTAAPAIPGPTIASFHPLAAAAASTIPGPFTISFNPSVAAMATATAVGFYEHGFQVRT